MDRDAGGKKSSPLQGYGDRWAYPGHILSLPHEPTVRSLSERILFVRKLTLARAGRHIHPSVLGILVERFPGLKELDVKFHAIHRRRREAIVRHRVSLALALCTPGLENLETLRIELDEHTPLDHGYDEFGNKDGEYPAGEVLNRAVCGLAQHGLRELHLDGAWPISPALFGACEGGKASTFQHLKIMNVTFLLVTYDGRWLFRGNPEDVEEFDEEDVPPGLDPPVSYEEDMDIELPSDYEDEFEFYGADDENGDNPQHQWRERPDPGVFNPIVKSLVKASLRMPRLEHLRVRTAQRGVEGNEMEIEFVAPGRLSEPIPKKLQDGVMVGKRRWVVSIRGGLDWEVQWEIPRDTRELMEEGVGPDGRVIVYGWNKRQFLS
ncbi:hypothetical protein BJX62DRAFT_214434 [Aspergillus germanicus]